jgi:hypothetical protein
MSLLHLSFRKPRSGSPESILRSIHCGRETGVMGSGLAPEPAAGRHEVPIRVARPGMTKVARVK